MFEITNRRIIKALHLALLRGVEIFFLTDKAQYELGGERKRKRLEPLISHPNFHFAAASGRYASAAGRMHYKLLVTREEAQAGGLNYTEWAEKINHDMTFTFRDPADIQHFSLIFSDAWKSATTSAIDIEGRISKLIGGLPDPSEIGYDVACRIDESAKEHTKTVADAAGDVAGPPPYISMPDGREVLKLGGAANGPIALPPAPSLEEQRKSVTAEEWRNQNETPIIDNGGVSVNGLSNN